MKLKPYLEKKSGVVKAYVTTTYNTFGFCLTWFSGNYSCRLCRVPQRYSKMEPLEIAGVRFLQTGCPSCNDTQL